MLDASSAAWSKLATRWKIDQVRHRTWDHIQTVFDLSQYWDQVVDLLRLVGIADPDEKANASPGYTERSTPSTALTTPSSVKK
jgi:hypothetical protein